MDLADWVLQISTLLALAVLLGLVAERLRLPLTVILAAVGVVAAGVGGVLDIESPLRGEQFEQVVVVLFLPVLTFEAALGLHTRAFANNLLPVLMLATVAVACSTALVGAALALGLGIPWTPALLFGALISATDPVAVVAVFRRLGVPRRLLTLVEGESLLNDAVAIVMFGILLSAALGNGVSIGGGMVDFLRVFFGGIAIGGAAALLVGLTLPWLDRMLAATLSVALAYGSFVVADDILGVSGVLASVSAGLVLGWLAPSHASEQVRVLWRELWGALTYVANALLFLLVGLAIDPGLLGDYAGSIALAIVAVLLARAAAIVLVVPFLERVAGIPPVGLRNQAVLIWGGLRGGVALALALALPEELAERERFVAMTGGVVLTTLALNATTVGILARRLGLTTPGPSDRFLSQVARLVSIAAARRRLEELNLGQTPVAGALESSERVARSALEAMQLSEAEEYDVIARRGLWVQRDTYDRLHDAGLLPPTAARLLLHEVDDQIEEVQLGRPSLAALRHQGRPLADRLLELMTSRMPRPVGEDPETLGYAEASARRLAAHRAAEALELFERLPGINQRAVAEAKALFTRWEEEAISELDAHLPNIRFEQRQLAEEQALALRHVAAEEELNALVEVGLLPARVIHGALEPISLERQAGRGVAPASEATPTEPPLHNRMQDTPESLDETEHSQSD